jgi:SulP family sulfate permease
MIDETVPPAAPHGAARARATLRQIGISLGAGALGGMIEIGVQIALAALIFAGPLAVFMASGVGLVLIGAAVMATALAALSVRPAMIGGPQDTPAVVVAVIAAGIAAATAGAAPGAVYATVVAAIAITSLATGATFLLLGQFRLGSLARYLPYPVVGGFLAGTGWLLLLGGVGVMAGVQPTCGGYPRCWRPAFSGSGSRARCSAR